MKTIVAFRMFAWVCWYCGGVHETGEELEKDDLVTCSGCGTQMKIREIIEIIEEEIK